MTRTSHRSIRSVAIFAIVASGLATFVLGASHVVRIFAGTSHGFHPLPPDRPVVLFDVERVEIVDRWVFMNVEYPGKRVRLHMSAMRPSAYDRSALSASAAASKLYAVLEVKRAADATCCSRIFGLVERRPPRAKGRLAIPVDTGYSQTYPHDPARPGQLLTVWFGDVWEFDVDDAEARSLVARGLVGKSAIVTVDVSDPDRLFVADLRSKS